MRVRLKKEIRELLPAFAITLLLVGLPYIVGGREAEVLPVLALVLGCGTMAGISFGSEFQRRTFPVLLAQPVARAVLWNEKMLGLGGALATVSVYTFILKLPVFHSNADDVVALVLVPLCAFAGAPLLTLLARNGIAGGVFALAVPGLLIALLATVMPRLWFVENRAGDVVIGALLIYCCVAYVAGYKVFSTVQVVEGGGRELSLPAGFERLLARLHWASSARPASPAIALLKKELRLQQISFLMAAVFVLVALAAAVLRWARPDNREWAEWIIAPDFFLYVCILPILFGAVAFAEERSWGLFEWQLTLPISAFKQWATKLVTTLSAGFVLGVLLPGLLLLAGWRLFAAPGEPLATDWHSPQAVSICLGQLLLISMASYAGSFSSSTLKAILFAVAMVLVAVLGVKLMLVFAAAASGRESSYVLNPALHAWNFVNWCLAGLLCLFQWLCFHNFRRSAISFRSLLGQWAAALSVFVLMVAVFTARHLI